MDSMLLSGAFMQWRQFVYIVCIIVDFKGRFNVSRQFDQLLPGISLYARIPNNQFYHCISVVIGIL